MKLYRIYTENLDLDGIICRVCEDFDGFTAYAADGVWKNNLEDALVIEIVAEEGIYYKVKAIAEWIKVHNEQEAVMITAQPITREFV